MRYRSKLFPGLTPPKAPKGQHSLRINDQWRIVLFGVKDTRNKWKS